MKLKKLLLPIASVASVAAVVAPIVTSCGSGVTFDGTKIWLGKSKNAVWDKETYPTGLNDEQGLALWFDDIDKDSNVFKDDVYTFISASLAYERSRSIEEGLEFDAKIKLNLHDIKVETESDSTKTLSFKLEGSAKLDYTPTEQEEKVNADSIKLINLKSFSFDVKHLRYDCSWAEGRYSWWFSAVGPYSSSVPETCSITAKANGYFTTHDLSIYRYDNVKFTTDKDHPYSKLSRLETRLLQYVLDDLCTIDSSIHMNSVLHTGN